MKVLFVTSELAPLVKVGGLADVAGDLPQALKKLKADIRIIIPKYKVVSEKLNKFNFSLHSKLKKFDRHLISSFKKNASQLKVSFNNQEKKFDLYSCLLFKEKIPLYLIEEKEYISSGEIYPLNSSKEISRFLFFSKAILEIFKPLNWIPDIIHLNDWHASALSFLLKTEKKKFNPPTYDLSASVCAGKPTDSSTNGQIPSLLTIHNFAYQGQCESQKVFQILGIKEKNLPTLEKRDSQKNFNLFQQGILNSNLITTVSPTYAKEILTKEFGEGLENDLKKRKKNLFGILNGIDSDQFDPKKDPFLTARYNSKMSINQIKKAKEKNKIFLQKTFNLPINSKIPLISLISRITDQKGFDLLIEIFEKIIDLKNLQIILLGTGDQTMENQFKKLSLKYPKQFSCQIKFDSKLANQIYAGSDFFLMPSKFEPCGLGQLIAMKYGTIPIVRATGGLKDTVENYITNHKLLTNFYKLQTTSYKLGKGFVFEKYDSKEMFKKIKQALEIYKDKKVLNQIIKFNMKRDFSWTQSAKKYLELYKSVTSNK